VENHAEPDILSSILTENQLQLIQWVKYYLLNVGSNMAKFAYVESRLSGRKRLRTTGSYAPVNLCDRSVGFTSVAVGVLRCVTGEDQVALFDSLVAGKAGFEHCLVGRFAVVKMSESPAAGRGVFF
jgi:hypothetical protein